VPVQGADAGIRRDRVQRPVARLRDGRERRGQDSGTPSLSDGSAFATLRLVDGVTRAKGVLIATREPAD
jgi:hypothetical protein